MESLKTYWHNHSPTGRWSLGWLGVHLAAILLVILLPPLKTLGLLRLSVSAMGILAAYCLAKVDRETWAAGGLCAILSFDFHLSTVNNYAAGVSYSILIIVSLSVVYTGGRLLGRAGIIGAGILGGLLLLIGQARFAPAENIATVAYLTGAVAIYVVYEWLEQTRDHGVIHRFEEKADHYELQLDTRRSGRLRVRVSKAYFRQLNLMRGDHITITRGENRAENGRQYIQATSIRIDKKANQVDQDND